MLILEIAAGIVLGVVALGFLQALLDDPVEMFKGLLDWLALLACWIAILAGPVGFIGGVVYVVHRVFPGVPWDVLAVIGIVVTIYVVATLADAAKRKRPEPGKGEMHNS